MTIYQASPPPWRTGDRTIQTFPSGLLRVDHTYIFPSSELSSHYATFAAGQALTDASAPAIDGLVIFPDPTISEAGNGLSQINVSGYGRTTTDLRDVTLTQITFTIGGLFGIFRFKSWEVRGKIVMPAGTPLTIDSITPEPEWLEPFDFFYNNNDWELQSLVQAAIRYRRMEAPSILPGLSTSYWSPLRAHRATMINIVTGETKTITFTLEDPKWIVESQNSFGAFVEMSIVGDRNQPSTTTI